MLTRRSVVSSVRTITEGSVNLAQIALENTSGALLVKCICLGSAPQGRSVHVDIQNQGYPHLARTTLLNLLRNGSSDHHLQDTVGTQTLTVPTDHRDQVEGDLVDPLGHDGIWKTLFASSAESGDITPTIVCARMYQGIAAVLEGIIGGMVMISEMVLVLLLYDTLLFSIFI